MPVLIIVGWHIHADTIERLLHYYLRRDTYNSWGAGGKVGWKAKGKEGVRRSDLTLITFSMIPFSDFLGVVRVAPAVLAT